MNLKEIRKREGYTQVELSNLTGIPRRTLQDIERRGDCTLSTAAKLVKVLGVTLDELYFTPGE